MHGCAGLGSWICSVSRAQVRARSCVRANPVGCVLRGAGGACEGRGPASPCRGGLGFGRCGRLEGRLEGVSREAPPSGRYTGRGGFRAIPAGRLEGFQTLHESLNSSCRRLYSFSSSVSFITQEAFGPSLPVSVGLSDVVIRCQGAQCQGHHSVDSHSRLRV